MRDHVIGTGLQVIEHFSRKGEVVVSSKRRRRRNRRLDREIAR
jgi:hypothetical protein